MVTYIIDAMWLWYEYLPLCLPERAAPFKWINETPGMGDS
jgi:hypothetical protein